MKRFDWPKQRKQVENFFRRGNEAPDEVVEAVRRILSDVRREGDRAVARYTQKFDSPHAKADALEVPVREMDRAWKSLPEALRAALELAARRIEAFHKRQRLKGWSMNDPKLGRMELRVEPIERAGVYAPGFKAAYPSTVLMDVIPARVAGVKEIVLATPPGRDGLPDAAILAAARLAGAHRVFRMGGAQAMAALAYGTQTVPRVDKIVGPGNIYAATAKQMLFGQVDIDSIAGPTEVLILADDTAPTAWLAADLLAQAEHDERASAGAVLIGKNGKERTRELKREIDRQLRALSRTAIATPSIRDHGYIVCVETPEQAIEVAELRAPEHLQIVARRARSMARRIRNSGAIFIGRWTPEPVGDYIAGPNHTLPTGGTARFFSPLSVWSFYKTLHTIEATREGLARHAEAIGTLAEAEGLTGHAASVRIRFESDKKTNALLKMKNVK